MRVIVIGCGVSGLSSGIKLLEQGHDVAILARDLPPDTTSNVAAAIWYPYRAFPRERVFDWGQRTLAALLALSADPSTGVRPIEGLELHREPVDDPWWRDSVPAFRPATLEELGPLYRGGYVFGTVVIETPVYIEYLITRFRNGGGTIERREVRSLDEMRGKCDVVVNCAGLGSRDLLGDEEVYPIRGQILRVSRVALERALLDEDEEYGVTYIVPRSDDCILGGTAQVGDWSLEPNLETARQIWERCAQLAPQVREATLLEHRVGLRPGRDKVRLEAETMSDGQDVVHNYGHGGAGITLSWGCAEDVAALVARRAT